MGLHQGSALSLFQFAVVMDRLTDGVRQELLWTMMFKDDIVKYEGRKKRVESSLEAWRGALEKRGMKVSRSKTEYLCASTRHDGKERVDMKRDKMIRVEIFKYIESTVQSNGECGTEVKKRVQVGWNG